MLVFLSSLFLCICCRFLICGYHGVYIYLFFETGSPLSSNILKNPAFCSPSPTLSVFDVIFHIFMFIPLLIIVVTLNFYNFFLVFHYSCQFEWLMIRLPFIFAFTSDFSSADISFLQDFSFPLEKLLLISFTVSLIIDGLKSSLSLLQF